MATKANAAEKVPRAGVPVKTFVRPVPIVLNASIVMPVEPAANARKETLP